MPGFKGKSSDELYRRLCTVVPRGMYSQQTDYSRPLYFRHEQGSRVWDVDGNEYLDLHMKYGAVLLGHHPSRLTRRMAESLGELVSDRSALGWEVGQRLRQLVPCFERMQLGLSGSEMVLHALRLARCFTGRRVIVRFEGNYHGTGDGLVEKSNELAGEHAVHILPWNDLAALDAYLDRHACDTAAILTEPVAVNGGSIEPQEGYLSGLRERCDRYGVLLIFDEIVTGLRLAPGGGQQRYNVIPDLCLYGKCLTNGLTPLTVLMGREEIMELYERGRVPYAGTYNGYALGLQAARLTLEEIDDEGEAARAAMNGRMEQIHRCLLDACRRAGLPLVVQGPVSCASFHVTKQKIISYGKLRPEIVHSDMLLRDCMRRHGILTAPMSRLYPSFCLTDEDVALFAERIEPAVADAAALLNQRHRR